MDKIVLTLEQMRFVEDYTCNELQITSLRLIEKAGIASAKTFVEVLEPNKESRILVFSGPHNNGQDAYEMAEELYESGYHNLLLISFLRDFVNASFQMQVINDMSDIDTLPELLDQAEYVIDGIFGTGINRDVEGLFERVIELINQAHKTVFSIDIPSGMNGHNGLIMNHAIQANYTGIIGAYKTGNLLGDALDYSGEMILIPIDLQFDEIKNPMLLMDSMIPKYPKRKHHAHKYDFGSVLTIGGSYGMFGSVSLASFAALRTGSGLSTIALKAEDAIYFHSWYPEVIFKKYDSIESFLPFISKQDAFLFGPGMVVDELSKSILELLLATQKPIIIDGGGIQLLKDVKIPGGALVLATPHVGELAKCLGVDASEVLEDPLKYTTELASKGITVVLKGPVTIIRHQDKTILMKSGNPGMATAGMGDVLSGILLSFLGRKGSLYDASLYGVSVHSMAGNLASVSLGEESLVASDLLYFLPQILNLGEDA